jgi:polysaccharide export outer membrane protein
VVAFRNEDVMKTMRTHWILTGLVAFSVTASAGSGAAQNNTRTGETGVPAASSSSNLAAGPQFQSRLRRYKIEPGDSFDITFELSPEFNQTGVSVQPDGFVALHGVGDVHVQGQTVPELTDTVRQAYGKILNDPMISIVLRDFQKPYFIADGQIGRPGKYELRGDTTLTEAIAIAGGFTDAAKHSEVRLYRRTNDGWAFAQTINVKKMESKGELTEDAYLHPGDMLFVPKNRFSKIRPFLPTPSVSALAK